MTRRAHRRKWWFPAIAIAVILVGALGYGFIETYRIEIKRFVVVSPDLPPELQGTRVALITDIHRGAFFSQSRVGKLVERINALKPDVVVLGGDYVFGNTDYEASCFAELANLEGPLGRFAVLGNHDYGENADGGGRENAADPTAAIEAIEAAGLTLLQNDAVWVEKDGARIRIGGVGDYDEDTPRLAPTTEETVADDFVMLASHNPDFAEELPAGSVDLVLSGHTHGGQVTFFGLWAPFLPSDYGQKYRTGVVMTESTTVIVSNGIGTIFPPLRFFARPQIVEITLSGHPLAVLNP